jgi:hypothetical protein
MKKEVLISIYLFLLAVGTWVNSVSFWQRENILLASLGTQLIAHCFNYKLLHK